MLMLQLLLVLCDASAPKNPYLRDSIWPVAHHDSFGQGSTDAPGPTIKDLTTKTLQTDILFDPAVKGALSIFWASRGSSIAWGSGLHSIFKVDTGSTPMTIIDAIQKPKELLALDQFRGIYSVVASDGTFYTSLGNHILAVRDEIRDEPLSNISVIGSFVFDHVEDDTEGIMSLNMLYTGQLAFLTNYGKVGVVTRDLTTLLDWVSLSDPNREASDFQNLEVSNAMTIDSYGGLYIVSSKFLHRLYFDSDSKQLHVVWPRRTHALARDKVILKDERSWIWATPYAIESDAQLDRLSKVGSGSTPTVFTHPLSSRLYVCITDGKYQQNVNVFDAFDGSLLAAAPVDFGRPDSKAESYTEQSLLVHGNEMVVVQNALTPTAKKMNGVLGTWQMEDTFGAYNAPHRFANNIYLAPVVLGDSPRGIQKFAFNIHSRFDGLNRTNAWAEIKSVWARSDFGCPNSIPTMSSKSGIMYCVSRGARGRILGPSSSRTLSRSLANATSPFTFPYPDGFDGFWTIAAIDWTTGRKLFDVKTGSDIRYNSLFAATQIGPNSQIIHGAMGGLIRLMKSGRTSGDS